MIQKKLAFYETFVYRILVRHMVWKIYIDIKTIELVKKQTMFPRKLGNFKGK